MNKSQTEIGKSMSLSWICELYNLCRDHAVETEHDIIEHLQVLTEINDLDIVRVEVVQPRMLVIDVMMFSEIDLDFFQGISDWAKDFQGNFVVQFNFWNLDNVIGSPV